MKILRSLRLTQVILACFIPVLILQSSRGTSDRLVSILLLLLFSLLALNTAACTLYSIWHRPPLRLLSWAPHLIHVGLLFLIIGLALSSLLRHEETAFLEPGEQHQFAAGIAIQLLESTQILNERGDLLNWESRLLIRKPGQEIREATAAVNQPLRISPFRLYQTDWEERPALRMGTPGVHESTEILLALDEGFRINDELWVLGQDSEGFYFSRLADSPGQLTVPGRLSPEDGLDLIGHVLLGESSKVISGLRLAWDPGALPAGIGGLLMSAGLLLYSIKRLRPHPESSGRRRRRK